MNYFCKVLVNVQGPKGPLKRLANRAVQCWSFLSMWPHLVIPSAFCLELQRAGKIDVHQTVSEMIFEPWYSTRYIFLSVHTRMWWRQSPEGKSLVYCFMIQWNLAQRTPLYNWHLCTTDTSIQRKPLYNAHLCTTDTSIQWTPLYNGHLYTTNTSIQRTPPDNKQILESQNSHSP